MAANLPEYMEKDLVEAPEEGPCPAGLLGDVRVNFVHYKNFDEGKKKWDERKNGSAGIVFSSLVLKKMTATMEFFRPLKNSPTPKRFSHMSNTRSFPPLSI